MIAKSEGGGPVTALCLAPQGPIRGHYTVHYQTCKGWRSGHHGAVDNPPDWGAETRALYEAEDAA
jgi:hypothetical protein